MTQKNFIELTNELMEKMVEDAVNKLWYRNNIVELNLRLVAHVLKKYRPYTDDQYQAGCMGLIVAVDTYRAETGVPFPNYACFCIERELHKMHRYQNSLIENILCTQMIYLDGAMKVKNEEEVNVSELIADPMADKQFEVILEENDLSNFFEKVVYSSIGAIAGKTKGQDTKIDMVKWKSLEIRYLLEMAQVDSQKARFNLSTMAKILGVSTKNIRDRHLRVIEAIKHKCKELGYYSD